MEPFAPVSMGGMKIVLASNNPDKLAELYAMLALIRERWLAP